MSDAVISERLRLIESCKGRFHTYPGREWRIVPCFVTWSHEVRYFPEVRTLHMRWLWAFLMLLSLQYRLRHKHTFYWTRIQERGLFPLGSLNFASAEEAALWIRRNESPTKIWVPADVAPVKRPTRWIEEYHRCGGLHVFQPECSYQLMEYAP